ncbi:MAG TPA: type I phosphomannose isomerase catalytic subunit [Sporichthyaceae bacterium]
MTTATPPTLYPLRFEPGYQYRLWGGRQLAEFLPGPLPSGFVGEAWLLSDREDQQSRVADGPLAGQTLGDLCTRWPVQLLGGAAGQFPRFPLLLKFLDAREMLSVQVHPSDDQAAAAGHTDTGKTEAWVVLDAAPDSCIYAGLKPGTTPEDLRRAVARTTVTDHLASFTPRAGDVVLLPAGTVHALGGGVVVFEVQQNSDLTYRLYDWNRVDRAGQRRELQIDQALACTDFAARPVVPVRPVDDELFSCAQFGIRRLEGKVRVDVGAAGTARVLVCIAGAGALEYNGATFGVRKGDVVLLPAAVGACAFQPEVAATLLEVSLPL